MALLERWSRGKYIAVGTLILAVVVVLFLAWPMFFGGTTPTVVTPSVTTSTTTTAPVSAPVTTSTSVHLLVIAGTSTIMDDDVSDLSQGENAFVLLKNEAAKDHVPFTSKTYPGMGDLVTSIGGFTSGAGQNYWQYTANGNYVPVGADDYIPKPGDTIVWKFTKSEE